VFRTPLADTDRRFDIHREFLLDPGERYAASFEGRERVDGRETYVLGLIPRVRSPYVRARLWVGIDDSLIRRVEILEESESIRTLELTNLRIDPRLAPDWFQFDPPTGVQVITR
jgi:outer membrane lipoprotein-sorting protein